MTELHRSLIQAEAQLQASTEILNKTREDSIRCQAKLQEKESEIEGLKSSEHELQSSLTTSRETIAKLKVDAEELKVWSLKRTQ